MKEKILQFAKGNFENAQASLQLSDTHLIIEVEEGRLFTGRFYIGNNVGISMKGILYSDCQYMNIKQTQFVGEEVSIEYTFSAKQLSVGETIESGIYIVTSCGEEFLPFTASIQIPSLRVINCHISDLMGFANAVRDTPEEALSIFTSDDFLPVFLHRDIDNQILYSSLIKSAEPRLAMEEFLIATKKKNRIILSVDKNNLFYSNLRVKSRDLITLSRSTWGCMDVNIYSDVKFIIPAHEYIRTEDYAADSISIQFVLDPDLMHIGKNKGSIYIETVHQKLEVNVECIRPSESKEQQDNVKKCTMCLMHEYLNFCKGEIDTDEYVLRMDALLVEFRENCSELMLAALQVHTAFIGGNLEGVSEYMNRLKLAERPQDGAGMEQVLEYAAVIYINALSSSEDKENLIKKGISDIRTLFSNGYECWEMMWFLLKLDTRYLNERNAFNDILRLFNDGCTSPLMYVEFCRIIKNNPEYMHEWHDSMIRPLAWGIREKMFDREMAMAFTYHVGRLKSFSEIVYLSLGRLYEQFELDDTLHSMCVMLIKADKVSPRYFKWYELGVEKQLRITQIYEYYMLAFGDIKDKILPNQVLMYFMYDNHLGDNEKAVLYAAAIRGKYLNPSAYKAYTLMIHNFSRKQLEAGNINANIAVLYEDSLKINEIDETVAKSLPNVMFRYEIVCSNKYMKGVCIVHRELEYEEYVPLINGKAIVNIYTDKALIFLVDDRNNRYLENQYYTMNKLLGLDGYADRCFEIVPDNPKLLVHMFGVIEKDYQIDQKVINVRRYINEKVKLRQYYQRKNMSALIHYYYEHAEGEYLDSILESIDLKEAERDNRQKWIELMMIRGMNKRALDACELYGHQNIDIIRLGKFCEELIEHNGMNVRNEEIIKIAFTVYEEGKYSDIILGYLAEQYRGPSEKMLKLWETLNGFEMSKGALEERLLSQMLFSEYDVNKGIPILESYLNVSGNKSLKKAFISYLAYHYLINDESITEKIWKWMKDSLIIEDNLVCTLAMLKRYSKREVLDEEETEFCDIKLTSMFQKGIVLPFYKEFSGKLQLPGDIEDKVLVSYITRPGINMMIKYTVDTGKPVIIKAKEMFYGIYVKELVVFIGETVSYEFFAEKDFSKNIYYSNTVTYTQNKAGEKTRFGIINRMIECVNEDNIEELYSSMSSYIKLEETSKQLFTIL